MSAKRLKRQLLKKKLFNKNRLVILNEDTFEEIFSLKLNLMNVFVSLTISTIFLITGSTFIIAFTPLREYIPGYSSTKLKREATQLAMKSDSLERAIRQNNLYVDNINIYGVIVPPLLKQQGYLIYPNPFRQQFIIRNYQVPVTLQGAHIYNSMGQLIWSKMYNGNAYTEMPVDLGSVPAGIYILKLQYSDKTIVERIIKQ